MRARGIALGVLLWTRAASADGVLDLDVDECALADAGCRPESADATLDAEAAGAMPDDPIEWASDPGAVVCAEQATNQGGTCVLDAGATADPGCVIGTSMHSSYPQYRYLDQGKHDLASITKQVNAIRHGSKRLRQQHGVGYYFVNKSDMAPPSAYSYAQLVTRLRAQLEKFR